jgi:hypothetical protein
LRKLAKVIAGHMGVRTPAPTTKQFIPIKIQTPVISDGFEKCPQCGLMTVKNENGCRMCGSCGWGQCSI